MRNAVSMGMQKYRPSVRPRMLLVFWIWATSLWRTSDTKRLNGFSQPYIFTTRMPRRTWKMGEGEGHLVDFEEPPSN